MPLDVVCVCGEIYFETNDKDGFSEYSVGVKSHFVRKYDPDKLASAAMFRLKDEFIGIIDDIPHDSDIFSEGIGPCPSCGSPLSDDNFKLQTISKDIRKAPVPEKEEAEVSEEDLVCHGCGWDKGTTLRGLQVHQSQHCPAKHKQKQAA